MTIQIQSLKRLPNYALVADLPSLAGGDSGTLAWCQEVNTQVFWEGTRWVRPDGTGLDELPNGMLGTFVGGVTNPPTNTVLCEATNLRTLLNQKDLIKWHIKGYLQNAVSTSLLEFTVNITSLGGNITFPALEYNVPRRNNGRHFELNGVISPYLESSTLTIGQYTNFVLSTQIQPLPVLSQPDNNQFPRTASSALALPVGFTFPYSITIRGGFANPNSTTMQIYSASIYK